MKYTVKFVATSSIVLALATGLVGCNGSEKTYSEGDIFLKEGSWHEKETGELANGIAREYVSGNVLVSEASIEDGKLEGVKKEYYESGKLQSEASYENGLLNGSKKEYYESGELKFEQTFKDDKPTGIAKGYYEGGAVRVEIPYENGLVNGIEKKYYKTGELLDELPYVDGKKEGVRKGYSKGTLYVDVTYKNDKPIDGNLYKADGSSRKLSQREYFELFGLN